MENKVLCKAKSADIPRILKIITLLTSIIEASLFIPIDKVYFRHGDSYGYFYSNIYDHQAWFKGILPIYYIYAPRLSLIVFVMFALFLLSLSLIIYAFNSRKCILELNPDGIQGKVKKLFSSKSINQPSEQIDNLYIRKNIIDIITGGKTIAISSGGSKIKFSCVANAQEFVDKTLEELKKYKESVNSKTEKVPEASSGNAMDDLLKLKSLLDQD